MKLVLGVTMALALAGAQAVSAGTDDERKASRKDAPRLLKDAVAAGTVDVAAFASITDWILHEKEEKVAAGLVDLLGAVEPEIAAASGARWNDTTRAVFALFAGVLRDAEGNRRRERARPRPRDRGAGQGRRARGRRSRCRTSIPRTRRGWRRSSPRSGRWSRISGRCSAPT